MAEKETVYVRGESGVVIVHDLPLPWGIQDRIDKGTLHLVEPAAPKPVAEEPPTGEPEAPTDAPEEPAAPKKSTRAKAE